MNKKISTMFASTLLMMGAVFGTANAQEAKDVEFTKDLGSYYYIAPTGSGAPASYLIADEVTVTASKAEHTTLKAVTTLPTGDDADLALFKISKVDAVGVSADPYFKLTNKKTGATVQFKVGSDGSVSLVDASDAKEATYTDLLKYPTKNSDKKYIVTTATGINLVPLHGGATENTQGLVLGGTTISFTGTATAFRFLGVSTTEVSASELNATLKNGFVFNAKDIKAEDNIFAAQTIKAFKVATAIQVDGADYTIPVGTYFATEYPKELAATNVTSISNADLFKQCTFIVADPVKNQKADKKDEQKVGKNFGFKLISGDDFNFYTVASTATGYDKEKISQGSQVSINNAIFKVLTNKDNEDNYAVVIEKFRFKKEASVDKLEQGEAKVYVANVDKVLMTAADAAFPFTFGDAPVVKPLTLLNDSTASIYNIRFVSGEKSDSEKGKYLGVGVKGSTIPASYSFLAQGSAIATLTNPQYQFVISNVNVEKNQVTFKNRETGESFTCVLYSTDNANQYYVADGNSAAFTIGNLTANGSVEYKSTPTPLAGTTIELSVATVDKFAGFANRDENAGYTYVTFALDKVSKDNLYMFVQEKMANNILTYEAKEATQFEENAALFELVKSEKPVISIRNNYQYLKDGVAAEKIKGDTVAYYTYAIKWINPELTDEYYVKGDLALEKQTEAKNAVQFILKENKNGSVSIVNATSGLAATANILNCNASTYGVSFGGNPYVEADADAVKLFLSAEQLGASLEAKNQHIAFQSSTGGYLSMNAAAEGNVAIKTVADEDLTFWVDSADTKATMPSFFISKGVKDATNRMYMYFAEDSSDYYIHNPHYNFNNGDVKMIFKSATLANSDTLATTVNGEAVKVAAKADANGTLGGLNYFKFQIFKDSNADDVYVIRNKANNRYLKSINGLLTLGSRADAIRVYAEPQSAPTSNDAATVSTITVLAKDGAVEVIGAAGKRVVVSNILGQAIANTVAASDTEVIAAPAGVVVVAVEGETAVKAIVK